MEQLSHYTTPFKKQKFPITVICDSVYFQQNIGSIFRICEAFNVEKIIFSGKNLVFSERKINKTARHTHKMVPYEIYTDEQQVITYLKTSNLPIFALEITNKSIPIQKIKHNISQPLILVIGSEVYGLSEKILSLAHTSIHIEMFGKNSSMNVAQALGICLYELTKQK